MRKTKMLIHKFWFLLTIIITIFIIPTNVMADSLVGQKKISDIFDPITATAVAGVLNKDISDDVDQNDLDTIIGIDLSNSNIIKMEGVQYLSSLNTLLLNNNQITNLKTLNIEMLNNKSILKLLYLADNKITDISHLASFSNLMGLILANNQISDIQSLNNFVNLYAIDISGNQISDLSPLSNSTIIEELYVSKNQITDISVLKKFTNIKYGEFDSQQAIITGNLNNNTVSILNPLKDEEGKAIPPSNISNNGIYNAIDNTITWTGLKENDTVTFDFSHNISSINTIFDGIVTVIAKKEIDNSTILNPQTNDINFYLVIITTIIAMTGIIIIALKFKKQNK